MGGDGRPGLEPPQALAGVGIQSGEIAFHVAHEDQPSRRGERPRPGRRVELELPLDFPGGGHQGLDHAPGIFVGLDSRKAPQPEVPRLQLLLAAEVVGALLPDHHVEQPGVGIVGRRHPVGASPHSRALPVALRGGSGVGKHHGPPLGVDSRGPGDPRHRVGVEELSGLPVQDVVETVAIGLDQQLSGLALHFEVQEHRNLVGVPVVDVVRRELEVPLHLAGVGVQRHH